MSDIISVICGAICGVCLAVIMGVSTYYIVKTFDTHEEEEENDC